MVKLLAPKKIKNIYKTQAGSYVKFAENAFSWTYLEKPTFKKLLTSTLNQEILVTT